MKLARLIPMAAALIAALTIPAAARAQSPADKEAVRKAALDYVEGVYNVQPSASSAACTRRSSSAGSTSATRKGRTPNRR